MSANGRSAAPILDVEATLARLGGDEVLFAELGGFLLHDLPPLFEELRGAVAESDAAGVRQKAHALKGLVAGCGGTRATHIAQAMENAGKEGDIAQAASLIEPLDTELEALIRALKDYRASSG
jgi:HPt (histidine-containing phosphotransfer) domain-containing protein